MNTPSRAEESGPARPSQPPTMKQIITRAALLLLPLSLLASTSFAQETSEPVPATEAAVAQEATPKRLSPLLRATRFANDHGTLRYTIFDFKETTGEYVQKTKISTLKSGREVLDLVDYFKFKHSDDVRVRSTRAFINPHFDLVELSGDFGEMGTCGAKIRNGKMTGQGLDGAPFEFTPPEHLKTRDMFQRGLYNLPSVVGEPEVMDFFALENYTEDVIYTKVAVIYKGMEEITAQGVKYNCRRYVARVVDAKGSTQYWYGPENRLIRLRTTKQTWELMAKGQKEPVPVVRSDNPMRRRRKAREELARKAKEVQGEKQDEGEKKDEDGGR